MLYMPISINTPDLGVSPACGIIKKKQQTLNVLSLQNV